MIDLYLLAQNGIWVKCLAERISYHIYIHHKDFFFEIPLCRNKVIFSTEFAILQKRPHFYKVKCIRRKNQKMAPTSMNFKKKFLQTTFHRHFQTGHNQISSIFHFELVNEGLFWRTYGSFYHAHSVFMKNYKFLLTNLNYQPSSISYLWFVKNI